MKRITQIIFIGGGLLFLSPGPGKAANPVPPPPGGFRTNAVPVRLRSNPKTNLPATLVRSNTRTNVISLAPRTGPGTNAAPAKAQTGAGATGIAGKLDANRQLELVAGIGLLCLAALFIALAKSKAGALPGWLKWGCRILGGWLLLGSVLPLAQAILAIMISTRLHLWATPRAGELLAAILGDLTGSLLLASLGIWLFRCTGKKRQQPVTTTAPAPTPSSVAARPVRRANRAIHSCNVLLVGDEARQLWQFDARGGGFVLNREQTSFAGESLPAGIVGKDWRSLFQRKLNIAWLPPEQVFVRVAQLPLSDFSETLAMVELQLEKLSPMPVTQIVWSIQVLPHAKGKMQTVIVMIAARNAVEEFLGQLEGQGYLADALELPLLDQLQATRVTGDGAWIYPEAAGGKNMALVAWWYGGVLQNLDLITLTGANRPANLREQLLQMAWAGEMDGWLTSPPQWHLVASSATAAEWEPALRTGLDQAITVLEPLSVPELAALTARRSAQAEPRANLLPVEFSTRYQQQFVDRLWMRGLGAVVALYLVGVAIYGVALGVLTYRTSTVEQQVASMGPTYTNAIQLKSRLQVLQERQELKFAALDCWNGVAKLMPESLTLDSLGFNEGKRLAVSGTAPADQVSDINEFENALRKYVPKDQPLFDQLGGEHFTWRSNPGGPTVTWSFSLELKRSEALQ